MKKTYALSIAVIILGILISAYFLIPRPTEEKKLSDVLNVYNWEEYFAEETIPEFEEEYGVKVNLETYEDEDIMLSSIQTNPGKYDIVVPSDAMVRDMISMRLLEPLDFNNIPNMKNIDEEFLDPSYDPGNRYSVPYMWGTTGIAVNTKYVDEPYDSWAILWDPKYEGKIAMLNSMTEVVGASLKYLGYPLSSTNPSELEEARLKLLEQKPLLVGYLDPMSIIDGLISEDILVAHTYSGDAYLAMEDNPDIVYIIPEEGGTVWVDNLVIPIASKHKYTGEVFINYILRPDVNTKISDFTWYATANKEAKPLTDPEMLEDPGIYPTEEIFNRLEYMEDVGGAISIYNQIWAELHAS